MLESYVQKRILHRLPDLFQPTQSFVTSLTVTIALGLAYFLATRLGLELLKPDGVAVFWPAAGPSEGTLIALGPHVRRAVITGVASTPLRAAKKTWGHLADLGRLSPIIPGTTIVLWCDRDG